MDLEMIYLILKINLLYIIIRKLKLSLHVEKNYSK